MAVALFATVVASAASPSARAVEQRIEQTNGRQPGTGICESTVPAPAGASIVADSTALQQACRENMHDFERAYRITFWFALLALVLSSFLPGWPFA